MAPPGALAGAGCGAAGAGAAPFAEAAALERTAMSAATEPRAWNMAEAAAKLPAAPAEAASAGAPLASAGASPSSNDDRMPATSKRAIVLKEETSRGNGPGGLLGSPSITCPS